MYIDERVSYPAVNEAYCLLSAYCREEGKLGSKYDKDELKEFIDFLASSVLFTSRHFNNT